MLANPYQNKLKQNLVPFFPTTSGKPPWRKSPLLITLDPEGKHHLLSKDMKTSLFKICCLPFNFSCFFILSFSKVSYESSVGLSMELHVHVFCAFVLNCPLINFIYLVYTLLHWQHIFVYVFPPCVFEALYFKMSFVHILFLWNAF